MNCPTCSQGMSPGKVFLEKNFLSFLVFGFGSTELHFRADEDGRKHEELNVWDKNDAYKCEGCGALLIAGRARQ